MAEIFNSRTQIYGKHPEKDKKQLFNAFNYQIFIFISL